MKRLRDASPLLATVLVIGVNAAANIVPINGYRTGELSDLYPTGFTPAGWAFSIWSLIYLALMAYSLALIFGPAPLRARARSVAAPYLLSAAGNAAWIFAWHYRLVELSFAIMLLILGSLIVIYRRLREQGRPSTREILAIDAPFSLYLGWITTAAIANLGTAFHAQQHYPFGLAMDQWALVSIVAAIAIYVWMGAVTRDVVYCAVFVWASLGIAWRPEGVSEPVRLAALTGACALLLTVLWIAGRSRPAASATPARYPRRD